MAEKKEINCASTVVVRHAGHERSAAASTHVLLPNGRLTGGGNGKVVEQVTLRKWLNGWLTGTGWNKAQEEQRRGQQVATLMADLTCVAGWSDNDQEQLL
ncbi:hypothetical protein C0Q70_15935 [Pomacea canaliculata]|uniref:Uncharacterized protein n=1 Tax=Pomacea canaliculata TaxID=400727 RepID=A0A2T7NND0_POMCA|nr:hypothetical protein C0Q70_15935 [Pomacea canaliculata]